MSNCRLEPRGTETTQRGGSEAGMSPWGGGGRQAGGVRGGEKAQAPGWAGALQGGMTSAQVRQTWSLENNVRKGVGELHAGGLRGERELRQAKQADHGR